MHVVLTRQNLIESLNLHRDMGLYDDRLADLSEPRRGRRVLRRRHPMLRRPPEQHNEAPRKKSTRVQSLLFKRSDGWTPTKAKAWAKSHGYKYGKVDVTGEYVRLRQFNPKGFKTKRIVPFGRGIRGIVVREGTKEMAKARRKHRRSKKAARKSPRRRRRVKAAAVAAPRRRRRRRKVHAVAARRRRRAVRAVAAPRRRRRRAHAWRGDSAGHSKAARKGWRRKKTSHRRRRKARETVMEAPRRRRRRRKVHAVAAPRRHRRHRRHHMMASRGSGMSAMDVAVAVFSGSVGFLAADAIDRLLATYNPASTSPAPTDKFTSTGTGTLANTLNVSSKPNWKRAAAAAGAVAVPAAGAYFVKNRMAKTMFEGMLIGTGISAVKLLAQNVLIPMLIGKDTSDAAMKKSKIARLYPAETAAKISALAKPNITPGALSGPKDVGPFAVAGDSPYPDASQALRRDAGVHGDSPYPDAAQALRAGTGGDSPYPNADQALRAGTGAPAGHGNPGQPGLSYEPGPPPGSGPGPKASPHTDPSCGCGDPTRMYSTFLGEVPAEAN